MVTMRKLQASEEEGAPPILERPDGFYWRDDDTGAEFGPFASFAEALADASASEDAEISLAPGSALLEVEDEIGINDWIDPDTGAPAEGHTPHIEDH